MSPAVAVTVAGAVIAAGTGVRVLSIAGTRAIAAGRLGLIAGELGARRDATSRRAPVWFAPMLEAAGVDHDPAGWWRRWVLAVVSTTIGSLVVAGPGAGAVALVAAAAGPVAVLHGLRHRGEQRLEESLPLLLDVTAAALRSGASLPQALAAASSRPGRLAGELRQVTAAVERGASLVGELDRWAERQPMPGLRLATTALALGADAGGARAQAVDGVADTLRDRLALRREINAQSAQARSSAAVMTAVPVVVALLAAASDPRTAAFLFRSWPGVVCVLGGLTLDGTAGLWMLRLIRNAS
jgi:tight adherence protein B